MSKARGFITARIVTGMLIVVPAYLAVLLLVQGMKSVGSLVRPVAALLPDSIPAEISPAAILDAHTRIDRAALDALTPQQAEFVARFLVSGIDSSS